MRRQTAEWGKTVYAPGKDPVTAWLRRKGFRLRRKDNDGNSWWDYDNLDQHEGDLTKDWLFELNRMQAEVRFTFDARELAIYFSDQGQVIFDTRGTPDVVAYVLKTLDNLHRRRHLQRQRESVAGRVVSNLLGG